MLSKLRLALVTAGAAARLTRLASKDLITEPIRYRIPDRNQRDAVATGEAPPKPHNLSTAAARMWAHELVTCPWCIGMWISAATVTTAHFAGHRRAFLLAADALAVSQLVGLLHEHADDHEN